MVSVIVYISFFFLGSAPSFECAKRCSDSHKRNVVSGPFVRQVWLIRVTVKWILYELCHGDEEVVRDGGPTLKKPRNVVVKSFRS